MCADDPRATGYLRRAAERAAAHHANDTADRSYTELTGRVQEAVEVAAAEAARAERAGERLAETDARTVHAAALAELGRERDAADAFRRAAALAEALPYPAAARRLALLSSTVDNRKPGTRTR